MPDPNEQYEIPEMPLDEAIDPAALDAMNAALERGPDVTADPPSHGQDPSDQPPTPAPGEEGAPASTTPAGEPSVPPDGTAPAKPEDGEQPPAVPVESDNPPEAGEKPDDRPSDEFGELPKDVKAETRERFEAVKVKYDALAEERDRAALAADTWHKTITSTGASPEQFGQALMILREINSGTPEGLRRAYDEITAMSSGIAKQLGLPAPGVDPLADHPDLQQRVEDNLLEREDALEIAAARAGRRLSETVQERRSEQSQAEFAHQSGLQAVAALGARIKAANPAEFDAKFPFIKPMIDNVIAMLPPDQWTGAIERAYAELPMPAQAAPAAQVPRVPAPIRPGAGVGAGVVKEPGSALEAMEAALARQA